jgi:hypothetical protein
LAEVDSPPDCINEVIATALTRFCKFSAHFLESFLEKGLGGEGIFVLSFDWRGLKKRALHGGGES